MGIRFDLRATGTYAVQKIMWILARPVATWRSSLEVTLSLIKDSLTEIAAG
jgi:hypothetical protein